MIEHPQYGDWESSIYDHDYSRSAKELKAIRQKVLQAKWKPQ